MQTELRYSKRIFHQPNEEAAKGVILTPEVGLSPDQRWTLETQYLKEKLVFESKFSGPQSLVIDYGCGIGRMARVLPHTILGVDFSMTMRRQSETYVCRDEFSAITPEVFDQLVTHGLQADGAYAIWVLQHVQYPEKAVFSLFVALKPEAPFYVVNKSNRAVPTETQGWQDDGIDIRQVLNEYFTPIFEEPMPQKLAAEGAFFAKYIKRTDKEVK